jgi:sugar transferase (PEP-CTERM/EpsH1 system associated)
VPVRVHGEHGWDVFDPGGNNRKYQWLRRLHSPWVDRFVPLSRELESYLVDRVGIPRTKITRIYNGVDTTRFRPHSQAAPVLPASFAGEDRVVIGTVGRMHGVKDQTNLAAAFVRLCRQLPDLAGSLRLVMLGDGPLRADCLAQLHAAGLTDQVWLPGSRDDVPAVMQQLDVFVLPSLAEGVSNTILEAMATGLPVVATAVGGNAELVAHGETGVLVPPSAPATLAAALADYVRDGTRRRAHGMAARQRVERLFGLPEMMARYTELYDSVLRQKLPESWAAVTGP